jgi:hypothetical protein
LDEGFIMTEPSFAFRDLPRERPRQIVTENSAEFFSLCDRQKSGEFVIQALELGKGNGQWIVRVRYRNQP